MLAKNFETWSQWAMVLTGKVGQWQPLGMRHYQSNCLRADLWPRLDRGQSIYLERDFQLLYHTILISVGKPMPTPEKLWVALRPVAQRRNSKLYSLTEACQSLTNAGLNSFAMRCLWRDNYQQDLLRRR